MSRASVYGDTVAEGQKASALYLPGAAGNSVSCPDSDALSNITTTIDLIWHGALEDYMGTGTRALLSKKDSYYFSFYRGKLYFLWWNPAGTSLAHEVAAPTLASYEDIWIRCSFEADTGSGRRCRFYRSADGASWEQVGTTQTSATATQIRVTANPTHVGQSGSDSGYAKGLHRKVIIKNGIDGAVAAEWDGRIPATRQRDPQGNIWTVNGTANGWVTA